MPRNALPILPSARTVRVPRTRGPIVPIRRPLTTVVEPFTLVHATLPHPERFEYLVDVAQAVDVFTTCRTLMCLAGHTHVPCFLEYDCAQRRIIRHLATAQELTEISFTDTPQARRYLFNPGSGIPV